MSIAMAAPAPSEERPVSAPRILAFYVPLALNALLLTLVGPVLNVAIGRAQDPKLHLAAFWIAFSVLLLAQCACQVLQPVSVALLGGRRSTGTLAASALVAGLGGMAVVLLVARTAVGEVVFHRWIPATDPVAQLAREVLGRLAPVPMLVALRGVAAGAVVVARRTALLTLATVARIAAVCAVVVIAGRSGSGALTAAMALRIGVAVETALLAGAAFSHGLPRLRDPGAAARPVAYGDVLRMGAPLAITAALWTLTRPVASAILGRLTDPDLAQASFGVVLPIVFVTCAPLWALLEVALVLPASPADLRGVMRFAAWASLVVTAAIGLLALSPLRELVLRRGFHLAPPLERAVAPALVLIALEPWLVSARAIAQALLMRARWARPLLILSPVKILMMVALGTAVVAIRPEANGALLAIGLVLGADMTDAVLYGCAAHRACARGQVFPAGRRSATAAWRAGAAHEAASALVGADEAGARRAA